MMKTEHALDWSKTAAEISSDYERIAKQRDDLHSIVRDCLASIGNGSGATEAASIEFLRGSPEEIRLEIAALKKQRDDLLAALEKLLRRDMINTCQHEETHRGGFLWEICDQCGASWADDRGGKPEFKDPQEWIEALSAIASVKACGAQAESAENGGAV